MSFRYDPKIIFAMGLDMNLCTCVYIRKVLTRVLTPEIAQSLLDALIDNRFVRLAIVIHQFSQQIFGKVHIH